MRDAKYYDRTNVVNFLRENAPAGTTGKIGSLLPELVTEFCAVEQLG